MTLRIKDTKASRRFFEIDTYETGERGTKREFDAYDVKNKLTHMIPTNGGARSTVLKFDTYGAIYAPSKNRQIRY